VATNPDDYFSTRYSQSLLPVENPGTSTKYEALQKASRDKVTALDAGIARAKQRELANANSLVGQLGLNPNGVAGQAVNLGASVYSGAARVAGDLAGFVAGDYEAMVRMGVLSEDEIQAVGRHRQGIATPADLALINTRKSADSYTALENADLADKARARSASIDKTFDQSSLVQGDRRAQLSSDLGDDFQGAWDQVKTGAKAVWDGKLGSGSGDLVSGFAKLVYNAGEAAVTNPGAAAEYIAENIPQLAIGVAGKAGKAALLASNVGYASEEYQKGIANYQKENGGAYPPQAERIKMAGYAASLALAEQLGDVSLLKGAQGAAKAVEDTARIGFKQSLKNTVKETAKGFGTEAATEGYQTFAEGQANLTDVSAQQIYEGAVIGGIAGGGLSGGGRALGEVLKATPEHLQARDAEATLVQNRREAQEAAIATGDVTALLDKKNTAYSPSNAIAALAGHAALPEATTETRDANLAKASEIVAGLEKERDELKANYDDLSPEGLAKNKEALAAAEAAGQAEQAEVLREMVKDAETADPKEIERTKVELAKLDKRISQANEALSNFAVDSHVLAGVDKTSEPDTVINLSMAAPERLKTEEALALADDTTNSLSTEQRSYLRAFSAARIAENKARDIDLVSQEILTGSKDNVGLSQYRERVASALLAGNLKLAKQQIDMLARFDVDHKAKAEVVALAWEEGKGTNTERTKDGRWAVSAVRRTRAQLAKSGDLEVNTPKLIDSIRAESQAISAVLAELQAAIAAKSTKTQPVQTQGTTDVSLVSQALNSPEDLSAGSQVQTVASTAQAAQVGAEGVRQGDAAGNDLGSRAFNDLTDPDERLNLYRGEGPGNISDGAWWSFDRADAEKYAISSKGKVITLVMTAKQIGSQTAQGQLGPRHRVFPSKADVGIISTEQSSVDIQSETVKSTTAPDLSSSTESSEKTSADEVPTVTVLAQPEEGNPLSTGLKQVGGKSSGTKKPLAVVKDFLVSMLDRAEEYAGVKLSDAQKNALTSFKNHATAWSKTIAANLPAIANPRFRYEDALQYLLSKDADGNPTLDENVLTAISYAAYSWVAAHGSEPAVQTRKAVNSLLGLSAKAWAGHEAYSRLGTVGTYEHILVDALGGAVIDALGFKATDDMSQELLPKLRASLGAQAMKLLEDRKLIARTTIYGDELASLRRRDITPEDVISTDKDGKTWFRPHHFMAVARENGAPVAGVKKILDAVKGTQGVLDRLFDSSENLKLPALEPVTTLPDNIKGSRMKLPSWLKKVLLVNQSRPRLVDQEKIALMGEFSPEEVQTMIGVVEEENFSTHLVNRHGVTAKNQALKREYDQFIEWVGEYLATSEKGLATPFFLRFMPWKQQRVGVANTVANPQSSKIVRHMVYSPNWVTKVDSTSDALMDSFYLRVAEGLGIKTERKSNEAAIDEVKALLQDPVYQAAIQALRKSVVRKQSLTDAERAAVVAGVVKGKAKMHSLDALVGMAIQQEAAQEANGGAYSFTVKMMGEVDGVANGTMLNHILLGASDTSDALVDMLEAGGFYTEESGYTNYNLWRETPGHLDIYESTARKLYTSMQGMLRNADDKLASQINSLWAISGEIFDEENSKVTSDGRNLIKEALNPLGFGSSMRNVIDGMSTTFLASVYAGFEKLSIAGASQQEVDAYVKHLNVLMGDKGMKIPTGRDIEYHMENSLHPAVEAGLKGIFADTVGASIKEVIEDSFGSFIQRRDALNSAARYTYGLYDAIYQGMRTAYIEELLAKNELPLNDKGERIGDLSKKQEAVLAKRMRRLEPVIETRMSKKSGDVGSGLFMAKSGRSQNNNPEYKNNSKFGTPLADPRKSKSRAFQAMSTHLSDPGVAMGSATTHSTDSDISHSTQEERDVLNIHDAVGDGVAGLQESARLMNKNTWEAMLGYSPLMEAHESLARVVTGLANMVRNGELSPHSLKLLQAFVEKEGDIDAMLEYTLRSAADADTVRLGFLAQLAVVDQYAFQGGQYDVTAADRAKAEVQLEKLTRELTKDQNESLGVIEKVLELTPQALDSMKTTPVVKIDGDLQGDSRVDTASEEANEADSTDLTTVDPKVVTSPFGAIGTAAVESDPKLVEFLSQDKSAKQVLQMLNDRIKESTGRVGEFSQQLIRLLYKTVSPDLMVRVVSTEMGEGDVQAMPATPSHAWYVSKGNEESVYVLSPEFKDSGLTVEILLHELTHGALAKVVAAELKAETASSKYTSEALDLVRELDELREVAAAYAKKAGITGFGAALKDVQEFIAYGMTNPAFQRQVLSQISMKSRTQGNSLVQGMKAFIERVVGILFKGSAKDAQAQAVNGLTLLVNNVSGLFMKAAEGNQNQATGVDLNLSMAANTVLNDYSTVNIHNALNPGALTPEFSEKLQGLLVGIVQKLHGPFGVLRADLVKQQALTPQDVWAKALATGEAPFASSVLASPLAVSEQESHAMEQVEAVVRAVLDHPENTATFAYKELSRLFLEVREVLKPSDFSNPDAYDFIFKVELAAAGRSNYLSRFAAYALAHQEFSSLIEKAVLPTKSIPNKTAKTFGERVQVVFEKILAFFHDRATQTYRGQPVDVQVEKLVGQLVDIEAKRKMGIARDLASVTADSIDAKASVLAKQARDKVLAVLKSSKLRNNPSAPVRAAAKIGGLWMENRADLLIDAVRNVWDSQTKEQHGLGLQMLTELKGPGKVLNLLTLASTNAQRIRKQIISTTAKNVRSSFADGGAGLTPAINTAITKVFLRTGLHVLVGRFNMVEIEQLLSDPKALEKAIADTEAQLTGRFKDQFIHQANALGYFRATGEVKHPRLMMNAHNIARLYGTAYVGKITEADAAIAEKHIEQLVALYALGYADQGSLKNASEVMRSENQRSDGQGHGVEYILALQKKLEADASKRIFKNQQALMMHGYTPEILNPNIQVKTATKAEGDELVAMGYKELGRVTLDAADPDTEAKFLYAVQDGGLMSYRSGITSLTGKRAKGSTKHSGYMNVNTADGLRNASMQADINHLKFAGLASGPRPNLSKTAGSHMAPVVNPQGEVVNWRYMMVDKTKDTTLMRDNSFDKVLGTLASSIYDKETSLELNTKAFKALKEIDLAERNLTPDAFVKIGPRVADPDMQEIWQMLPEDTREVARNLWGRDGMYVRKDQLSTVFGYRKFSLADALRKEPHERAQLERVYATAIENIFAVYKQLSSPGTSRQDAEEYAKRAAVYVARGERVWQDIVKEIKDIVVVKSVVVSLGNISSNISLLLAQGVPLKDVLRGHLVALRGARAHQQDTEELSRLQAIVDTGTAGTLRLASIEDEIRRLKDAIARNPVHEMIEAGLMPTIVEDIAEEEDVYSYKSALIRKTEKITSKLPSGVVTAAKGIYMSRDSNVYQGLSRLAQVSDFAARYALYQHMVNRAEKPLSKEDAVHQASEAFINYDVPMPKFLQFTDDMGITMFSKYVLRIQRVLGRMAEEHPARILMLLTVDQFVNLGPIVLDSSWIHKAGNNPLNWGALQLPGALDELATVHAAMALVK
jgi:hypothetical protein